MTMSPTCSAQAHRNWRRLSYRQKAAALNTALRSILLRKGIKKISPDAVHIGLGPRRTGGEHEDDGRAWHAKDLALIVFVPAKRKDEEVPKRRRVHQHISMRINVDGKRRTLALPTDVRTAPARPIAQMTVPLGVLVTSTTPGLSNSKGHGVLCAVVRKVDHPDDGLYGLTCHHVACRSKRMEDLRPDPNAVTWSGTANDQVVSRLGKAEYVSKFAPIEELDVCIDAALVGLADGSDATREEFWSFRAASAIEDQIEMMKDWGNSAVMYSRRFPDGTRVSGPVLMPRLEVDYDGETARIRLAAAYEMLDGETTQPGDSGSAIVVNGSNGEERKLLAMHFCSISDTAQGFAIPAHLVLRAFNFDLELV